MSDDADYFVTDTGKLVLPPDVQSAVDALVSAFRAGKHDERAYTRLTSWLDEYGDDLIFDGYEATVHAISPDKMRSAFDSIADEDVTAALGHDSGTDVTDAQRVAYLEEHCFPGLFEDGDDSSSFTPFRAIATDGSAAVLVNDTRGYSFSGITSEWFGPYATFEEFLEVLEAEGWAMDSGGFQALPLPGKLRILHGDEAQRPTHARRNRDHEHEHLRNYERDFPSVIEEFASAAQRLGAERETNSELIAQARAGAVRVGLAASLPTTKELAALIGIAASQIPRYEMGTPIPPTVRERLEALARGTD